MPYNKHEPDLRLREHALMTIWTSRVGLELGRSAHYGGPMPGAAAIVLAGRNASGSGYMPGEEERHDTNV